MQARPRGVGLVPAISQGTPIQGVGVPVPTGTAQPSRPGGVPQPRLQLGKLCPSKVTLTADKSVVAPLTHKEKDENLINASRREAELPLLVVVKSAISLYSWEEMKNAAPVVITKKDIYGPGSVNDPRMGIPNTNSACQLCARIDCPGHLGRIEFPEPIYNPATIRSVVSVLTCVCGSCAQLLLTEMDIKQLGFDRLPPAKRLAEMEKHCKDLKCLRDKPPLPRMSGSPLCGTEPRGEVMKCGQNRVFTTSDLKEKGVISYKAPPEKSRKNIKDLPELPMSIETVCNILDRISDEDAKLMGFPKESHPRNMIMRGILVPPPIARPPLYEGGSMHHDQLTHMFMTIRRKATDIMDSTDKQKAIHELYTAVKQLFFKTEGKKMGMRDFISLVERIQGKQALLRGLLMGKRVNDCGRTVAGPDATLRFGQVRIPSVWAKTLTKKVKVTSYNIHNLTALLEAGKITHITSAKTGLRKQYRPEFRYRLQLGDTVFRWLMNGDRIVVNRQPTLHRQSMMSYEVVLGRPLTIGLHLSYTSPMNCDFDGDENNAWNPQDFEVEAECEVILDVRNNTMSAEQNRPIMGWVMNSITGAYLLTKAGTMVDDDLFSELMSFITDQDHVRTLHARLTKYGVHPRSGAAVFSALLPPDFNYSQGEVQIVEGILMAGRVKKSHVGASHRSIIQELWKNYGAQVTANFFTDGPWVINKWLIERGFSVGISDTITLETKDGEEYDKNKRILKQELAKIYVQLEALGGKLDDAAEEAFRQRQINNLVNIAGGIGLRLAKEALSGDNSIGVMSDQGAGTKGGLANIGQMMGSVGQQFYRSKRLAPTLSGGRRILPTYDYDDNNPEAHAFIPESFFTGISPEGLFFLQAGGREGLLDTALKTAETGAMQHRMIKAFENIIVAYDGSVRNTIGTMFSPIYNAGYDIAEMIAVKNLEKRDFSSFIDIESTVRNLNIRRGWVPKSTNKIIEENRAKLGPLPVDNVLPVSTPSDIGPKVTASIPYDVNVIPPLTASPRKITKYEKARIIGTRARQIDNNAPISSALNLNDDKYFRDFLKSTGRWTATSPETLPELRDQYKVEFSVWLDPVRIATAEYEAGVINIFAVRGFADGAYQTVYPTLENI